MIDPAPSVRKAKELDLLEICLGPPGTRVCCEICPAVNQLE